MLKISTAGSLHVCFALFLNYKPFEYSPMHFKDHLKVYSLYFPNSILIFANLLGYVLVILNLQAKNCPKKKSCGGGGEAYRIVD